MYIQVDVGWEVDAYEGLVAHVRDVVERAVQRHAERVTRVEVHLGGEPRPGGWADDTRCLMEARVVGRPPTIVTHRAGSLNEVVEGAAAKLGRSLAHALDRTGSAGRP